MIEGRERQHGHESLARGVPQDVVVVIAAYREAVMIGKVIAGIKQFGYRVVVVDDGSGDETATAAEAAGADVLRHAINLGQGSALVTGLRCALERYHPRCLVTFDADDQHDPADIASLITPVDTDTADVVLGTRFGQGSAPGIPMLRRLALRTAARFSRFAYGVKLTDSHNGLRALSPDAATTVITNLQQPRMAHASEFVAVVCRAGMRIVEVPVTVRYSAYSLAKGQHLRHAFVVIWDLLLARMLRQ